MSPLEVGFAGIAAILVLMAFRVPIGLALGVVAIVGIAAIRGIPSAYSAIRGMPWDVAAKFELSAIPMFILMGSLAHFGGLSAALFKAARLWVGALPGGLAISANFACAGFAAASGASVATAAAMGKIAIPEMLRSGYDRGLATGVVAAGGTLGIMIPPSIGFVLYGIFAEVSISKLLIAGILPGILTAVVYALMIVIRCTIRPELGPPQEVNATWGDRLRALGEIWPLLVLILGVIGGIYGGLTTPTEAGAFGAFLALAIAVVQGKMTWSRFMDSILEAVSTTARIFFIVIGAVLFSRLLSLAGTAPYLTGLVQDYITDPLPLILASAVLFIILGMFLDALGLMLLTLPVLLPLFAAAKMDLIWFGVLTIKFVEIGLITPPVGMNVYVIKGVAGPDISLETVFKGVFWFIGCEVIIVTLLVAFPQISLYLPNLMS
ncbi:MAG: TRAP transporter large permease [Rhodospirillales bacterium]